MMDIWVGVAGVFSAVDSSSSRLYLDTRCVSNRRPMIDGGKHGTKGSVQVELST
jgi:ubiquitin-activating enzyme E1